jgi:hypothetical protein
MITPGRNDFRTTGVVIAVFLSERMTKDNKRSELSVTITKMGDRIPVDDRPLNMVPYDKPH